MRPLTGRLRRRERGARCPSATRPGLARAGQLLFRLPGRVPRHWPVSLPDSWRPSVVPLSAPDVGGRQDGLRRAGAAAGGCQPALRLRLPGWPGRDEEEHEVVAAVIVTMAVCLFMYLKQATGTLRPPTSSLCGISLKASACSATRLTGPACVLISAMSPGQPGRGVAGPRPPAAVDACLARGRRVQAQPRPAERAPWPLRRLRRWRGGAVG
jgi:hypothetical protein